jgi:hypothetical protein
MANNYFNPDKLYRFECGRLSPVNLVPGEPFRIDEDAACADEGASRLQAATFLDCREDPLFKVEVLPVLADATERMAPWVRWYAAPTFLDAKGETVGWGGIAHNVSDVLMMKSCCSPSWGLDTVFQELWHVLEDKMTAAEREAMAEVVAGGPRFIDQAYSGSVSERQARAFAAWCVARLESPAAPVTGWRALARKAGRMPHERVWEAAWSGELGRRAMARNWCVSRRRLSESARNARDAARSALGPAKLLLHPKGLAAA